LRPGILPGPEGLIQGAGRNGGWHEISYTDGYFGEKFWGTGMRQDPDKGWV